MIDNSGHAAYVTSAVVKALVGTRTPGEPGWVDRMARKCRWGLDGTAEEVSAILAITTPVLAKMGGSPLHQAAEFLALMSSRGITSTSEMTYAKDYEAGYQALFSMPGCPVRISLYHMSTDPTCGDKVDL